MFFIYSRVYLTGSATRYFCLGKVVYVSQGISARSFSLPGLVSVHRQLNTRVVFFSLCSGSDFYPRAIRGARERWRGRSSPIAAGRDGAGHAFLELYVWPSHCLTNV